jgi:hypothetical protein
MSEIWRGFCHFFDVVFMVEPSWYGLGIFLGILTVSMVGFGLILYIERVVVVTDNIRAALHTDAESVPTLSPTEKGPRNRAD